MLLSFFVFFSQWVRISICCNWSSHGYANKLSDAKLARTTKQRFHTFLVVFFHSLWWILIQYLFTLLNCLHLRRGPLMGVVRSTFRTLTELLPLWICWLTCRWNTPPSLSQTLSPLGLTALAQCHQSPEICLYCSGSGPSQKARLRFGSDLAGDSLSPSLSPMTRCCGEREEVGAPLICPPVSHAQW